MSAIQKENLKDTITYQENSIVSRQIIRKDQGNLTLFAFSDGQELSEHTAPFDAFVWILEGMAEVMISGQRQRLEAGQSILMPANQPHAVKAVRAFKMLLVMIRG